MLPTNAEPEQHKREYDDGVRPGTWWRLAEPYSSFDEMPKPNHGLVLMISEVRVIDGDKHTVVLHPHPLWSQQSSHPSTKFLYENFLSLFILEENGESLRESEIAELMQKVSTISSQMNNLPDPQLLLASEKAKQEKSQNNQSKKSDNTTTIIPSALLPSQDVVDAQNKIENRITALEAQKNWISKRTDEIKQTMTLVAIYQEEKVQQSLASISQETQRAEQLLQGVQTMRLFLGEDIMLLPVLEGKGAPSNEPLYYMQRMLFLDEEIIIADLLEGFSSDHMSCTNLADIFSKNPSILDRILPFQRCATIARIRRNERPAPGGKMDIQTLFQKMNADQADKRILILIRNGENVSILIADETTSRAKRFFPSRHEIDHLFTVNGFGKENREIRPDDIMYSDARAMHDQVALFYKRFLILLWGIHERTDTFGSFVPKGTNWLTQQTHQKWFRYVHDEENVIDDGKPSIENWFKSQNASVSKGSRIIIQWSNVLDGYNAPSLTEQTQNWSYIWKAGVEPKEAISVCHVETDNKNHFVRCPALRKSYNLDKDIEFNGKVTISQRSDQNILDIYNFTDGFLCIDNVSLEDINYYINSRQARVSYLRHAHILMKARQIILDEVKIKENLLSKSKHKDTYLRALNVWRSGNDWKFPFKKSQFSTIEKIAKRMSDTSWLSHIKAAHPHAFAFGLLSNGNAFTISVDKNNHLPDKRLLPWFVQTSISSFRSFSSEKKSFRSAVPLHVPGSIILDHDDNALTAALDLIAPECEKKP